MRIDDDPEETQISGKQNRPYNLSYYQRKNKKQKNSFWSNTTIFTLVIFVVVLVIISIFVFKNTNKKTENPTHIIENNPQTPSNPIIQKQLNQKDNSIYLKQFEEIDKRLSRLQMAISKLQSWKDSVNVKMNPSNIQNKLAKISLNNSDATALTEFMSKELVSQKTILDMLHMQAREQHFYGKVEYLKRVEQASGFLKSNQKARIAFLLSQNNFKLPHPNIHIQRQIQDLLNKQYDRLSKTYDFNLPELPFCLVVPTLNNAKEFRYQYNLQSMMNLNYKNYKIVIVDDASTDNTYELIKQFIADNPINQTIHVVKNTEHMTAVPNIHLAITKYCGKDDIAVLIDGDDEVLGRHPLKAFNHVYQKQNADVVYSNHIQFYRHTNNAHRGWSMSYSQAEKDQNRYRDVPQRIAHLRSFKVKLFLNIKQADLKEDNGDWFRSTYDQVICLPILQMSCGRNVYIDEYFYLYNFGIGTNDLQVDGGLQKRIADFVKFKKQKYTCLNQ